LLGKPVLDGDIPSLNPSKFVQLLPERLHEACASGSSAWVQDTDAEDSSRLLRVNRGAMRKEHGAKQQADH